jgi:hypothetical protein
MRWTGGCALILSARDTEDAIRMAEELLARIEARETIHRRELAALAHAALELPHVLLGRDVLNQKGPGRRNDDGADHASSICATAVDARRARLRPAMVSGMDCRP